MERLGRVDQSGAKVIVALTRPEALGAHRENAANVGRRELGVALKQKGYNAADLGGRFN
jgi:hypothetical protein